MRLFTYLWGIGFGVMLCCSCDLINPAESIPAYLYITPFEFEIENTLRQGTGDQKITEAWVSIDGEFLGTYSLPALVPILKRRKPKYSCGGRYQRQWNQYLTRNLSFFYLLFAYPFFSS
ncbi:MAG: hypothetical protein HC892_06765 [Saprospiraceae bacterium]|nr:hypothetical protein [Saprospiraceae bacterium]